MTRKVLISAPYFLPVVEDYRSQLEAQGCELVIAGVRERLSEAELLTLVPTMHGAICGDDQFSERVLQAAGHLKVIRNGAPVSIRSIRMQRLASEFSCVTLLTRSLIA